MLLDLKITLLRKGIRQTRMAVDLGWDPAKLSRIVNELSAPTTEERTAIARYLGVTESDLFGTAATENRGHALPLRKSVESQA